MKFKQFMIDEEYFGRMYDTEVHKNPSKSQIQKLAKDSQVKRIRFAINFKTEDIFVWDAYDYVHIDVIKKVLEPDIPYDYHHPEYYMGNGRFRDGFIVHSSDSYKMTKEAQEYLKTVDDEWTKYYFGQRLSVQLLKAYNKLKRETVLYDNSVYKDKILPKSVYDLDEEYITRGKAFYGGSYEIFKNPSKKEMAECSKPNKGDVRLLVDLKEKNLYIWDIRMTHADAAPYLEGEFIPENSYPSGQGVTMLWAYGFFKEGKLEYWDEWWGSKAKVKQAAQRLGFTEDYDDSWMKVWFSITPKEKYLSGNVSDILNEEYVLSVKEKDSKTYRNELYPIFKNPSKSEMIKLPKDIRFCVNFEDEEIFVWDAELLHDKAFKQLWKEEKIDFEYTRNDIKCVWLTATKVAGKLDVFDSYKDLVEKLEHWESLTGNINWIKKYISHINGVDIDKIFH